RAAVEGMLCGLADAVDALAAIEVPIERVMLIGGAASSGAVREFAPTVLGHPVLVPPPGEYVADGAARQAAWVLSGDQPDWQLADTLRFTGEPTTGLRERYAKARRLHLDRGTGSPK
ncbi:MAG: FGGY-family carbohydrate kinase, partial [Nitriliruptoraceae bacterium]